jgi:hypothetical protein
VGVYLHELSHKTGNNGGRVSSDKLTFQITNILEILPRGNNKGEIDTKAVETPYLYSQELEKLRKKTKEFENKLMNN